MLLWKWVRERGVGDGVEDGGCGGDDDVEAIVEAIVEAKAIVVDFDFVVIVFVIERLNEPLLSIPLIIPLLTISVV